ncbi:MAG: glucose-6-phosphate isomerase [Alphaproteobacteria bacterium]|nr:glucose-6-phosphate isomerase [Alphaproteobacteria bacterium]
MMIYNQNLDGCQVDNKNAFKNFYPDALTTFRTAYQKGELAPLSLVEKTDDITSYQEAAERFENFDDILILGTGGSSLGGKTLYALAGQKAPRLHFMDNIDPHTFSRLFETINPKATGVLAISKSGSTVETLMQLAICLQRLDKKHFMAITEPTPNTLRKIAEDHQWTCLDHPTNVGGRYSCFSVVGLLPTLLAGLDAHAFREGARTILENHLTEESPPALQGAAMAAHHNKPLSVMLPYADQLDSFALWYRQLWAESVGKDGKGTTPIRALGTVDQHSQLQLYLDGPKDKFFTLITPQWQGRGEAVQSSLIPEFTGKTMGDLFDAELRATYETLVNHKCPTRLITVEALDERSMGALMMHFMIETIITSYFMGVNAFDQPAVEEGKRLAREYLAA